MEATKAFRIRSISVWVISTGVCHPSAKGIGEGLTVFQLSWLGLSGLPPFHDRSVEALRPAWASCMPGWAAPKSLKNFTMRAKASSCSSVSSAVHPGDMRPMASTAVASANTSPAPDTENCPKCIRCQSVGTPSLALYWHIGAITIRLGSSISLSFKGENNWLVMIPLYVGLSINGSVSYVIDCLR